MKLPKCFFLTIVMITTVSLLFGYKSTHQEELERYGDMVVNFETINGGCK